VDAKLRDIPLGSDEGAFGDDEAGTGSSLDIILQIDMIWHSGGNRTIARHGRHADSVTNRGVTDLKRFEER
jgi:hypothetical protein